MKRQDPRRHALFPGTFDPVTLGHLDLVRRSALLFERTTLLVANHPTKRGLLAVEERIELLEQVLGRMKGVSVARWDGLVVDAARELGAGVILRGVRSSSDAEYELSMARSNRAMAPEVETLLLSASSEHAHISSTLVRQIAEMGGNLEPFVPTRVARALRRRFPRT